ncbi:ROK family transcriptional regulator [Microbacterium indicum]|uniref:ROK family transcriptional regulator n=1 Tax=Microbacterium indicum TaxID=358100 RepID=UPI000420781D|nr:ROK family transcriptional regulator [Microbacterium indicum]
MATRMAGLDAVRRGNLGEILRLVHHSGPRSRAVLTAETGLNRSTVADLVSTLADAGLVVERDPDPSHRVGRPSPVVVPAEGVVAIGVNPEVDAVEIAAVGFGGAVRRETREAAAADPAALAATVARVLAEWALTERVVGVGVAVPGLVRAEDGVVRLAPHLGWRDADVAGPIARATGLPVAVGNDASLGARAEHLYGAARGVDDMVYLNGGASGIGGGLVLGGRIIGGADGYAGEWGQNRASVDAADRRTETAALEDEVNRQRLLDARADGAADDEVARQRRILASTLANAVNVIAPRVIVLGGFLADLRAADAAAFDGAVRLQALDVPAERVELHAARLAGHRLLIGAAEIAFDRLLADPLG